MLVFCGVGEPLNTTRYPPYYKMVFPHDTTSINIYKLLNSGKTLCSKSVKCNLTKF